MWKRLGALPVMYKLWFGICLVLVLQTAAVESLMHRLVSDSLMDRARRQGLAEVRQSYGRRGLATDSLVDRKYEIGEAWFMDKSAIAAQLYTLREHLKTPEEMAQTLKKVKEIGYDAVQVSGLGPVEPARLGEMADRLGLRICVTHTPFDRIMNDADSVIREHKLWGCEYVGLGAMPAEYRNDTAGYLAFAKEFSEVGKRYAGHGLQLVYHNHRFEFERFGGVTGMEILLHESDPAAFGFELDTYWVQAGGADPVAWIRKVKGRMGVIHLKDMAIVDDQQVFAEIGQGNLDWTAVIGACRETGVRWYAVEQDVCRRDPFASLETSLRYLEKLCLGPASRV